MSLVCIPVVPTHLLTPILLYIYLIRVWLHMRQMWHFWHFWHKWRIWHATFVMVIYGIMGVKRFVRPSGMQTKAIKKLLNMFYKKELKNTDFWNFPLYFLKFPLYNVRGLGGHFPLEFRAHLYVFGISGGRGMGKHTELNLIPTFIFFGPP